MMLPQPMFVFHLQSCSSIVPEVLLSTPMSAVALVAASASSIQKIERARVGPLPIFCLFFFVRAEK